MQKIKAPKRINQKIEKSMGWPILKINYMFEHFRYLLNGLAIAIVKHETNLKEAILFSF